MRKALFAVIAAGLGTLVYLPFIDIKDEIQMMHKVEAKHLFYIGLPVLIYFLIYYGHKHHQKGKINFRLLNRLLENWDYFEKDIPTEAKATLIPFYREYCNNNYELNICEQEAHNLIATIFKACINVGDNKEQQVRKNYNISDEDWFSAFNTL